MLWFCTFLIPAYNASSRVSVDVRVLNWHTKGLVSPRSIHLLILYNRPTYSSSISIACFLTAFRRVTYPVQTSVLPLFKSFFIPIQASVLLPFRSLLTPYQRRPYIYFLFKHGTYLQYSHPTYCIQPPDLPPLRPLLTSIQASVLSLYNRPTYSF